MGFLRSPKFWIVSAVVLIILSLIALTVVLLASISNTSKSPATDQTQTEEKTIQQIGNGSKGVSLSPVRYTNEDLDTFFAKADQAGTMVTWAGDWNDLDTGGKLIQDLSDTYDFIPISLIGTHKEAVGSDLVATRPLTKETMAEYKISAARYVEKYKPAIFGIGNEVDRIEEKKPEEFAAYVSLFSETVDEIKKVSPQTKIFVVFQYESLKGLRGGLFGGVNNTANNKWGLLKKFPKADFIAFTTYPYLIYKTPAAVPEDYYKEINQHTKKPIIFTEIGWPSAMDIPGWESSPSEQVEFVQKFFRLTSGLDVQLYIWPFLFDQDIKEPFKSIGLIDRNGNEKPAFQTWLDQQP